jgi:hypothetical protein
MVSKIANGNAMAITRNASTGTIVSRRDIKLLTFGECIEEAVKLDKYGNESCPAGLVAGAQPGTIVAVEVFKEVDVVAPERITLEFFHTAIDGSPTNFVAQEDAGEPVSNLFAHFKEVHQFARPGGAFDFEVVAVVEIEVQERPDNECVHGHPDRTAPIGVSPKHPTIRLRR